MFQKISLLLILLLSTSIYSQQEIKGKIIDYNTKEPLVFANIIFNNDKSLSTSSDIDGKFSYSSKVDIKTLSCSYVGYKSKRLLIDRENTILIELIPSLTELNEVIVIPGENPANKIIQKVIQNKDINNPENIDSFKYNSYNKTVYDFKSNDTTDSKTIALKKKLRDGYLFMMESVTERKFLKPDMSEEIIIASKVSGFKNPSFASLATDLQPFSFYKDNIKLFNINYINPISKGSLNKYKFKIEDTFFQDNDTVYVISFKPLHHKNFDGLTGLLHINTNKYAIQKVIASPSIKGKITLKIQQQYTLINNRFWFPEQLNYTLSFPEFPNKTTNMFVEGKNYINNVSLHVPLSKKDFPLQSVRIAENATQKDPAYWDDFRPEKLTKTEETTYKVIDSIGKKKKFDFYLTFLEKLSQNKFPTDYFDVDLSKTFVYNKFEGFRIGTGIYTNEKEFKNFVLGGFFGYGTKDKQWKYGGELWYTISKKNDFLIGLKHQVNLIETGNYGLNLQNQNLLSFRNIISYQFDKITENALKIGRRSFKYLQWNIVFQQTQVSPQYVYSFKNGGQDYTNYSNTSVSLNFRFAFKEKIIQSFNQNFSVGTRFPVLQIAYSKGLKNIFKSDFNYNKIEARIEQTFYIKNLGRSRYQAEGGFIDRDLPYGLLFTGEGSYDANSPYIMKNTFQTMLPYEFLSNRYANLFLSHNFGGLLFKVGNFQPDISMHHNISYGFLTNADNHQFISFKTKNNVFLESGLQVDNVLKFNYANLGYIGIGTGTYYRYGTYSNPEVKNNIAAKLSVTFTIK